jgi:hypothetical protein
VYTKAQKKLMFGYLAFLAISLWLKHHGETGHVTSPLDAILGAPVPFLFGVFGIQNGWIGGRYSGPIYREEAPVSFWSCVIVSLLAGVVIFLLGLHEAFQAM